MKPTPAAQILRQAHDDIELGSPSKTCHVKRLPIDGDHILHIADAPTDGTYSGPSGGWSDPVSSSLAPRISHCDRELPAASSWIPITLRFEICASAPYNDFMEMIAAGRITFWEGGSLWVFDVPGGVGAPSRNAMHAHHAFQLTFSLGGVFNLHLENRVVPGPSAIVAPDALHAFEARGLVALLFIEPESRAGRTLTQLMQDEPAAALTAAQVQDAPNLILEAFRHPRDPRTALREAGMKIAGRIAGHARAAEPDRRVRQIIKWARDHLDGAVAIKAAAECVGLSPSRASHLFVEETGLTFRTYVLWLRLVRAVDAHLEGLSLTEAAQEAGFSDSAHLSRTFKRMFGLPAATLEMS